MIDYYNDKVAQKNNADPNKDEEYNDHDNKIKEIEQLLKTFDISKCDSPCPAYTSITPLRILLRYRQDMTQQTMKLQNGENTKDEVDVSNDKKVRPEKGLFECKQAISNNKRQLQNLQLPICSNISRP